MSIKIYENIMTMASMQQMRLLCGLDLLESGMLKRALANSHFTLTANLGDRTVGMLRVVGDGSFVFVIVDVMVDPEFRNMGIASSLITYALSKIEKILPGGVLGTVSLFSIKGKETLYNRLGFKALPSGNMGPGMQVTVIGKKDTLCR